MAAFVIPRERTMKAWLVSATAVTLALISGPIASAQEHVHANPYTAMENRSVNALSDQQIVDLRAGRGMGLALAAELNGYPGPLHVMQHATALNLTADQQRRTRALFEAMKAEAIPLGQKLIAEETRLDRAFAERTITAQSLNDATAAVGVAQGALRATHLRYHLAQIEILTGDQLRRYAELRGCAGHAGHRQR
jgi:hypothetical protein